MAIQKEDKIVRGGDLSIVGSRIKTKLNEKQDLLVSGTNIKTINGSSLLGDGNITIEDGQDGKSAYQIWLDAGNIGTINDYLEAIKGDTGVQIDEQTFMGTIVNDLTTGGASKALSAQQGVVLDGKISLLSQQQNEMISALLSLVTNLAFSNENAQSVYNEFVAQISSVTISSISVVYSGGSVSTSTSLEELKDNLVVTVYPLNGVSFVTQNYTLDGSLSVGQSTIVVSYMGKTASFTVNVVDSFNLMENGTVITAFTASTWTPSGNVSARQAGEARASLPAPIPNKGYIISAVDDTKYQFALHNIVDLTKSTPRTPSSTYIDGYGYIRSNNVLPSWTNYAIATSNYVWITVKKMDGTDFTTEELQNAVGTIITYTLQD